MSDTKIIRKRGDDSHSPFSYTIGNTEAGYPELLTTGHFDDFRMLERLSEMMIQRGSAFCDGEKVNVDSDLTVYVWEATDNSIIDKYMGPANRYNRVMQVTIGGRLWDYELKPPWKR